MVLSRQCYMLDIHGDRCVRYVNVFKRKQKIDKSSGAEVCATSTESDPSRSSDLSQHYSKLCNHQNEIAISYNTRQRVYYTTHHLAFAHYNSHI